MNREGNTMLVSICIPCYRSAKTLPKVVEEICREFAKRLGLV